MRIIGTARRGVGDWRERIGRRPEVYEAALGIRLYPGTLNVEVDRCYPIRWSIVVPGTDVGEGEDFLFEPCVVNGVDAFRVRPYSPATGQGGHRDSVMEIVAATRLRRGDGTEDEEIAIDLPYDL